MPTWLQQKEIVLIKTFNGWAIGPRLDADARECVAFETWDAATYWLTLNWVSPT